MMDERIDKSEAARALSALGAAKGGEARAKKLTPEERSAQARAAALSRWEDKLPQATHEGELRVGESIIPCAVLEDGTRVLTQWGFLRAIGRSGRPMGGRGSDVEKVAPFLDLSNLKPYVSEILADSIKPVLFRLPRGVKAYGYKAELLPQVCEVYLRARDDGVLLKSQEKFAKACEILMRGLAHVGIIALVDEATGYQADRAKDDLMRILEAYISKALLPWTERFPSVFFKEIYRLHGWQFREGHTQGPRLVGKLINKLVYKQLPPGVLDELQAKNPVVYVGMQRKHKHHQWLTEDIGDAHLTNQVSQVLGIMRASRTKKEFFRLFERAFPKKGRPVQLVLIEDQDDKGSE